MLRLLDRDRPGTVYLRSLIHEFGVNPTETMGHGRFYGGWRSGKLCAVIFVGNARNMTTWGAPEDVETVLTRATQAPHPPRLFVGPEEHAPMVRRSFFREGLGPRLDRKQAYYVLTRATLAPLEKLPVRRAEPADLDEVVRAHGKMIEEDLQIPAAHLDYGRLRKLAQSRLDDGKIWVHMDRGRLVFKTEEIGRSEDAILVGGVYTHPKHRGQGIASRGIAAWADRLFEGALTTFALHVNAANTPAVRAYERVGFQRTALLRLILTY